MSTTKHVYALFSTLEAATAAHEALVAHGCSTEHCSAILHEAHIDEGGLTAEEGAGTEGARKGAVVLGGFGAVLGGLVALGGGLLGVGPLAAVAMGGLVFGGYGAVLGGIAGASEPEKHLRTLQREVENGKILVAVKTDDAELEAWCEDLFEERGGEQVVV